MDVTLVVFVDDLDRCLPITAISTLEAMRLFLFMDRTAFVIAADEKMIRQAVRAHFKDTVLDDDLVTNYFDKLIQIPIRVPPLGTQEVRAYLFLLFIENSNCPQNIKDEARKAICKQLGETWLGKTVDREFVVSLIQECPAQLKSQFELADRIAPLMTSAQQIRGNPRLIKRFLNTLYNPFYGRFTNVNLNMNNYADMSRPNLRKLFSRVAFQSNAQLEFLLLNFEQVG